MTDKIVRCFFAISLTRAAQQLIKPLCHQLQSELGSIPAKHLRWLKPQSLHATLFFLGNQTETTIEQLIATVKSNDAWPDPFTLNFTQCMMFPPQHPRVIALLAESNHAFVQLIQQLRRNLLDLSIKLDDKKVIPHLSLARCDKSIDLKPRTIHIDVLFEQFILYKSVTASTGAVYTPLAVFQL